MGIDLRWPIGLMFTLIGGIITVFGAVTGFNTHLLALCLKGDFEPLCCTWSLAAGPRSEIYARSLGININLVWGLVLVAFGASMLTLAWCARRRSTQPQGQNKEQAG